MALDHRKLTQMSGDEISKRLQAMLDVTATLDSGTWSCWIDREAFNNSFSEEYIIKFATTRYGAHELACAVRLSRREIDGWFEYRDVIPEDVVDAIREGAQNGGDQPYRTLMPTREGADKFHNLTERILTQYVIDRARLKAKENVDDDWRGMIANERKQAKRDAEYSERARLNEGIDATTRAGFGIGVRQP